MGLRGAVNPRVLEAHEWGGKPHTSHSVDRKENLINEPENPCTGAVAVDKLIGFPKEPLDKFPPDLGHLATDGNPTDDEDGWIHSHPLCRRHKYLAESETVEKVKKEGKPDETEESRTHGTEAKLDPIEATGELASSSCLLAKSDDM